MSGDNVLTPSGLVDPSAALRAQEKDWTIRLRYFDHHATVHLKAAERAWKESRDGDAMEHERQWKRFSDVASKIRRKRKALNQPRGLSASEGASPEAVTPEPSHNKSSEEGYE